MIMMNLILAICMYPTLLLMYFIQKGEGKEKMRTLFGVSFSKEWLSDTEKEALEAEYSHSLNRYLLVLAVIPIATLFIPYSSISFSIWMLWIFAVIVMCMLPYRKGNQKMMEWKRERCLPENGANIIYAELKNAGNIRCVRWQAFVPPCVISLILAIFSLVYFRQYKLEVFFGTIVTFAICTLLFYACAVCMDRMKAKVISSDSDINVNYTRACKKIYKNLWLCCAWLNNVYIIALLIAMVAEVRLNILSSSVILWASILYTILALYLCMRTFNHYHKLTVKYGKYRDINTDSEEQNWIWGIFYYNPREKKTLVNKRIGVGTTVNMATPAGKVYMTISALALLSIPIMCVWIILLEFTPITLSCKEDTLIARQLKTDYVISADTITEITLEEKLPRSSKVNGTAMDRLCKGEFRNSTDGRIQMFLNPENEVYLRIVSDDTIYYLGGYDDAQTKEAYQLLTAYID